jgi:hypothetical protein
MMAPTLALRHVAEAKDKRYRRIFRNRPHRLIPRLPRSAHRGKPFGFAPRLVGALAFVGEDEDEVGHAAFIPVGLAMPGRVCM